MDSLFYHIFGNMHQHMKNNPDVEYRYLIKDIKNILTSRGGNIESSDVLKYIDKLERFENNMKHNGASREDMLNFYREASSDLYPLQARLRNQ